MKSPTGFHHCFYSWLREILVTLIDKISQMCYRSGSLSTSRSSVTGRRSGARRTLTSGTRWNTSGWSTSQVRPRRSSAAVPSTTGARDTLPASGYAPGALARSRSCLHRSWRWIPPRPIAQPQRLGISCRVLMQRREQALWYRLFHQRQSHQLREQLYHSVGNSQELSTSNTS